MMSGIFIAGPHRRDAEIFSVGAAFLPRFQVRTSRDRNVAPTKERRASAGAGVSACSHSGPSKIQNPESHIRSLALFSLLSSLFFLLAVSGRAQFTDDNQTNLISAVVSNWVDTGYVVGSNFVFDVLQIDTGGVLSNGFGYIGYEPNANNNAAIVTGAGSVWTNSYDLVVGLSGPTNQLEITDGGQVFNDMGIVGNDSTSCGNSVLVSDPTSTWNNNSDLTVGFGGAANELMIVNGGQVFNNVGTVSFSSSSSNNSVLVTDPGSIWNNNSDLTLGFGGAANELMIINGGQVINNMGTVSFSSSSSNNSVLVTGPGSMWNNNSDLVFGFAGRANQLVISDGGLVMNNMGTISVLASSSNNTVLVTDPGSIWSNRDDLIIGSAGKANQLTISNGALVTNDNGYVGFNPSSSNNAALVTGPDSIWECGSSLYIGWLGSGNQLTISDGGTAMNSDGFIGYNSTKNFALVTGANSVWDNLNTLYLGFSGGGNSLVISNGGAVYNGAGYLGVASSSSGNHALVTGPGSSWSCAGFLVIGYQAAGNQLVISNGGAVDNGPAYLGTIDSSSSNSAVVSGVGSVWNCTDILLVGYQGIGNQLVITNGGQVSDPAAYIGYLASSSNNSAVVAGSGSAWNNAGVLDVRQGSLSINAGTVTASQFVLTNGSKSVFAFPSGFLKSGGTVVTNTQQFAVGNGFMVATFNLLGGIHSFNNGLRIRTNSFLIGCGTITGTVLMEGSLQADCGGTLTFSGSFTNNGTTVAANGTTINFLGPVVNNGTINALNGTVKFFSTFQNNGTFLTVDTNRWISASSGKWETAGNWSSGAPSINQPLLLITNAATKTVTIDATTMNSPSTLSISNLTIAAPSGSTNTLSLNNAGTLSPLSIRNSLIIGTNGAVVVNHSAMQVSSNVFLGNGATSTLTITNSGILTVSNALGNARLLLGQAGQGTLTMNGGTVTVDLIAVTNNTSRVVFNTGVLNSRGTAVTNATVFTVGDGVNAATFRLLGGVHSFNNGLRIRNNASLTGCGTINGVVVVDAGGTVLTDCGGSLTFGSSITNNGTMRAVNGSVLESYGTVVNNGLIDAINGGINFHAGFINNGTLLTSNSVPQIVSLTTVGSDLRISFTTSSGASYAVDYETELASAGWLTLTNIAGNGTNMIATDPGATLLPKRFYRVRLIVP
jgi:T5SS/PEP-CTERM-associated repeat protein